MTVTRRQTRPGELFLGGRGILTPYRPTLDRSDTDENKLAASTVSPDPLDALQQSSQSNTAEESLHIPDEQELFEEENEAMFRKARERSRQLRAEKETSSPATEQTPESTQK